MSQGHYQEGKIKWYNSDKGYGFVKMGNGGPDVFIHSNELKRSGINRNLFEGETLRFLTNTREQGAYATNISIVEAGK